MSPKSLRALRRNERGNVFIISAMTAPIVAFMALGAVEHQRASTARAEAQTLADSVVLAATMKTDFYDATNDVYDAEAMKAFVAAHLSNPTIENLTVTPTPGADGALTVDIAFTMDYAAPGFMRLINQGGADMEVSQEGEWSIDVSSSARPPSAEELQQITLSGDIEVALVLDVSGSMNSTLPGSTQTKISALIDAAKDAVDKLEAVSNGTNEVTVSLVPFNDYVAFERSYTAGWFDDASSRGARCPNYRGLSFDRTVITPTSRLFSDMPYEASCEQDNPWGMGLSSDYQALRDRITGFEAAFNTSINLGVAWGWRSLSPDWSGFWAGADAPQAKSEDLTKVMVIMTDGQNTADSYAGAMNKTASTKNADTEALCDAAKADGVVILTVAFAAPQSGKDLMVYCASDRENAYVYEDDEERKYFFEALTISSFKEDFQTIVTDIITIQSEKKLPRARLTH